MLLSHAIKTSLRQDTLPQAGLVILSWYLFVLQQSIKPPYSHLALVLLYLNRLLLEVVQEA
jgi:hypothetical protein